jgi:hypothetical protein
MSLLWVRAASAEDEPDPLKIHDPSRFGTPLFHGSSQEFKPGDIITPRSKKVAHATPHLRTARVWDSTDKGQSYQVEPVNHATTWTRKMKHTQGEHHLETVSVDGFRVVGKVPESHTDKDYSEQLLAGRGMAREWSARHGASWCNDCYAFHTPEAGIAEGVHK